MKKKIVLITLLFAMVSCDDVPPALRISYNKPTAFRTPKYGSMSEEGYDYRLVTLTFNGIPHEYVCETSPHGGGLCHYPECKFCKKDILSK